MEPIEKRLFFALWPEDAIRRKLAAAMGELQRCMTASWVQRANLHMTLAFLGDVQFDRIQAVTEAADAVALAPVAFELDRIEWWRKPRIVCLTSSVECVALNDLAAALAGNLRATGFAIERRPFRGHVTLARKAAVAPAEHRFDLPIRWQASSFALVESIPDPRGSRYAIVRSWPLPGIPRTMPDGLSME